jgi:predicted transposase YdaD
LKAYDKVINKEQDERGEKELVAQKAKKEGSEEGKDEKEIELILEMHKEGFAIPQIARITKKSAEEVAQIIAKPKNK